MPKILRIKVRVEGNAFIFFQVLEQSHRGKDFGDQGTFTSTNGTALCCDVYPELRLDETPPRAFVRGSAVRHDDTEMPFRILSDLPHCLSALKKIFEAVVEYNDDKTSNPVDYDGPDLPN